MLAIDPDHYHAHLQAGFCFLHQNKLTEAYREACEAVRLRPGSADGHRLYAYIYHTSKEYATSLKMIDQALALNPEDYTMYTLRANIYLNMGNSRKAIEEANKALSIHPESEGAAHILAIALCNQNRHTETLRLTYEALQRNPDSAIAWYQKGIQLRLARKYRAAKYTFFQALKLDPEMEEAQEQLDEVLEPSLPWYQPLKLLKLAVIIGLILLIIVMAASGPGIIIVVLLLRTQKNKIRLIPKSKLKKELYERDIKAWEQAQEIEKTAFHGMEEAEALMMDGQLEQARIALRPALRYAPQDPVIHQSCLTSISRKFILKRWFWQLVVSYSSPPALSYIYRTFHRRIYRINVVY